MNFFKKLFNKSSIKDEAIKEQKVQLSLDDAFVHHFTEKGGKFLYCISESDVTNNLQQILKETSWDTITCLDKQLEKLLKKEGIKIKTTELGYKRNEYDELRKVSKLKANNLIQANHIIY